MEITLANGAAFRLESGADGESLRLASGEWVDPFVEPLSTENAEFVERSGKWAAFDVSDDPDFGRLIGARLRDLNLLVVSDKVVGVELLFDAVTLTAEVHADELVVKTV